MCVSYSVISNYAFCEIIDKENVFFKKMFTFYFFQ